MTATSDNAELLAHYEAKIRRLAKVNGRLTKALEDLVDGAVEDMSVPEDDPRVQAAYEALELQ